MRLQAALTAAVALVLAATAAGCAADEKPSGARADEIVIGASLELSGPTASIGTAYRKALELKVKQLNEAGTLGGRTIRLVVRDNRTDTSASVDNINQLIRNDHASALIMGGCSACGAAAIPSINQSKVPAIALASASALTQPVADRRYIFKISPNPGQDATAITAELQRTKVTRVGLLSVNNVYGQEGQKAVTQQAGRAGIAVADAEQFGQADTTVSVQVSKIAAVKPDAVVVWAVMPAAATIVKGLRDAGYRGSVYLDAGAGAELFVKGAGAAAEGTDMVFPKVLASGDIDVSTPAGAAQKAWVEAYEAANGDYSGFASFAADAVQVIADAVVSTGSTDPGRVRDAIETAKLDGDSGPLAFSAAEHSGLQPAALGILQVRQGAWRLVK
ncbi:ABC transporter substrate-binding protein [Actinoplanes sp. NPDC049596]|uniref:ABC transporter substrate-binding protein n=1 Tax=unclassified Actinoplanes TaxID=2626549 RepID=UPI00343D9866